MLIQFINNKLIQQINISYNKLHEDSNIINKFKIYSIKDQMVKFYKIIFKAKVKTQFKQTVKIVGSIKELGHWSPFDSLQMYTNQNIFPIWQTITPIQIEEKTYFQFKLVITYGNSVKWQSIQNRKITISDNQIVICNWNNPLLQIQQIKVPDGKDSQQISLHKAKSMTVSPRKILNKNSSQYQNKINTSNFVMIFNQHFQQPNSLKNQNEQQFKIFHFNILNHNQGKKQIELEQFQTVYHKISKQFLQSNRLICIKRKQQIISYFKNSSIVAECDEYQSNQKQFKEFMKCRLINFLCFKKLECYIKYLEQHWYPVKKYKQLWISINQNGYQIILIGNFRKTSKQLVQLYQLKNQNNIDKHEQKRQIHKQLEKYFNYWDKSIIEFQNSIFIKKGIDKLNNSKTIVIMKFQLTDIQSYFINILNQILFEFSNVYWIIQKNIHQLKINLTADNYNKLNLITKKGTSVKLKNQQFKKGFQKEPFSLKDIKTKISNYNNHNIFHIRQYSEYYIELIPQLTRIFQTKRQLIKNEITRQKNIIYQQIYNKVCFHSHSEMNVLDKIESENNRETIIIGDYKQIAQHLIYRKKNNKVNCFKSVFQFKSSLS